MKYIITVVTTNKEVKSKGDKGKAFDKQGGKTMKIIFILHLFFILILSGCKVDEGFRRPYDDSLWPPDSQPEEDPDGERLIPIKAWTFEEIKAMTPREIGELDIERDDPDAYFQDLEHWNLEELTPDQLYKVFHKVLFYHERLTDPVRRQNHPYRDFPVLTPSQLQKLSVEHIKKALCVIIKYLSPAHLSVLDKQQLWALTDCIDNVAPEHIDVIKSRYSTKESSPKDWTFEEIKAMTPQEIDDLGRGESPNPRFLDLKNWDLSAFTPDQLSMVFKWIDFYSEKSLKDGGVYEQFKGITVAQVQALTPEHIDKILCSLIKYTHHNHIELFDKQHLGALESCITNLSIYHISAMDVDQISAVFSFLSSEQRMGVSPEYFRIHTDTNKYVVTAEQAAVLTKEHFENSEISFHDFRDFGVPIYDHIHWLSCEQLSWISFSHLEKIKPKVLASLPADQLKCISVENTFKSFVNDGITFQSPYIAFTDEQLRELSFSQLKAFKGNHKIDRIVKFIEEVGGVDFHKMKEVDGIYEFELDFYIQFLRPTDFQKISLAQAQHFPDSLLSTLTPERIKNFPHYVKVLESVMISDFTKEHFEVFPRDCVTKFCSGINLTKPQIRALSLRQMWDWSLDNLSQLRYTQVQAFSFEQLAQLSKEQLKALLTIDKYYFERLPRDIKFKTVMDIVEKSENRQAQHWVEDMLKPAVRELLTNSCKTYDFSIPDNYCHWMKDQISENKWRKSINDL